MIRRLAAWYDELWRLYAKYVLSMDEPGDQCGD